MKKILKNNQVIITALVLMIMVAGYLKLSQGNSKNFLSLHKDAQTVADQSTGVNDDGQVLDNQLYLDMDGAKDAASTKVTADPLVTSDPASKSTMTDDAVKDEFADISAEDIANDSASKADAAVDVAKEDGTAGDAVLVSNTIHADFFSSAKITREQTRAKNKETLMDVVNNANVTESQKQSAISSIIKMTDLAEKESAAEILLEAKGFKDVVISCVDDGADVLINAENLTEQQMAQIEDIVKRKTGICADKIVITPVGVVEK
ncbi:SpoIIIAH-like family protein [[Clostridium] polysaccharolyticum]|uniref:Stage III sporulation protein AH n=1 Tax=[Clostridium] polysaccharolyticum TaxID=29364 RepID=A0A1I0A2N1_9FIRM|nr:SpoIIIAH-like family protein [[Clostridium] polysaccharolyticum]SES87430.1 stage III sporulation protein AH [[Clostridium] polysaccharolyticum]